MFHNTLEQLKNLQEVLNEKFGVERNLVDLPKEIEVREQVVVRMKENFLKLNDQYQHFRHDIVLKKDEIRRLTEHREKLEKEVSSVSSQRDYEQLDRGINENLARDRVVRRELQILESKTESSTEEFTNTEMSLKEQEEDIVEIRKNVEKQLVDFQTYLQELKEKEKAITENIDEHLVFKFERIVRSKGGDGIVPIRKNVCYGCHMLLPIQFVNEVCKEEEVLTCPYCSKIVYYDGDTDAEEVRSTEIAGLQDIINDDDIELDKLDGEDYEAFMLKDDIDSDAYMPPTTEEEENSHDEDGDDLDDSDNLEENDTKELDGFYQDDHSNKE